MDANVSLSHTRAALSRVLGLQKSLVGGGLETRIVCAAMRVSAAGSKRPAALKLNGPCLLL